MLLDRDGVPAIAFDDTDTLHSAGPLPWQAVEAAIKAELWRLSLFGLATRWNPESGVVGVKFAKR